MDLQLFYRDTEQVDNWMSKQEVTCERRRPASLCVSFVCCFLLFVNSSLSL